MPDDARRDAAFYDHENEPRRHVVDWGADELFTRMPRRRTVHTPPPPRARRPEPLDPVHRPGSEPTGRFERLDGEAPSAGDVLSSGSRFAASDRDDGTGEDAPYGRRFTSSELRNGASPAPRRTASTDGDAATGRPGTERRGDTGVARADDSVASRAGVARGADDGVARRADDGAARRAGDGMARRADDGMARRADARVARRDGVTPDAITPDAVAPGGWTDSVDGRWSDAPGGRRTVVISGRPDGVARPRPERYRPPRTVAERLGPRPERIVAWAFALGLLLIIIAIATADAGHV